MDILQALVLVKPIWLTQVISNLEVDASIEVEFKNQLSDFFEILTSAVSNEDPTCLDSILEKWAGSITQTDLNEKSKNTTYLIEQIFIVVLDAGDKILPDQAALLVTRSIVPIFIYAINKISHLEMESRISLVSSKLTEAKAKLERLDQSKSKFIGVAAHELKTPLTLIDGYASMLKDLLKQSQSNDQTNMCLDGIRSGTTRLRNIVNDMIDVSRIDNNLLSLSFQPVWLNQLFLLLKSELLPTLTARKQTLELKSFNGESTMLYADPERLHQSFRNILINAIKYTPDEGSIIINGRSLPGFIEVIISDTGIGISEEDQLIIFGKFGQSGTPDLHSSGKTKFKGGGPGLGLPIARGIIEAHGGAIWAESPGYNEESCPGSTFHIILPILSEPPDPKLAQLLGIEPNKFNIAKVSQS